MMNLRYALNPIQRRRYRRACPRPAAISWTHSDGRTGSTNQFLGLAEGLAVHVAYELLRSPNGTYAMGGEQFKLNDAAALKSQLACCGWDFDKNEAALARLAERRKEEARDV